MYKLTDSNNVIRLADSATIPNDSANRDYADYLEWIAAGGVPEVADLPTPEQIQQSITSATQSRLDTFAGTRGYGGILSACTYATSTNAKFAGEGQYCVGARDATWAKLYQILDEVLAGTRPMPTGYADIEPELPVLAWPV